MSSDTIKPVSGNSTPELSRIQEVSRNDKSTKPESSDSIVSHTSPEIRPEDAEKQAGSLVESLGQNQDKAMDALGGLDEATVRALLSDD